MPRKPPDKNKGRGDTSKVNRVTNRTEVVNRLIDPLTNSSSVFLHSLHEYSDYEDDDDYRESWYYYGPRASPSSSSWWMMGTPKIIFF